MTVRRIMDRPANPSPILAKLRRSARIALHGGAAVTARAYALTLDPADDAGHLAIVLALTLAMLLHGVTAVLDTFALILSTWTEPRHKATNTVAFEIRHHRTTNQKADQQ